jgi:hypothetical protein
MDRPAMPEPIKAGILAMVTSPPDISNKGGYRPPKRARTSVA